MKKILVLLIALLVTTCNVTPGFTKGTSKIDELKIKRLVSQMTKYSNAHDLKKVQSLYSPDFKSGDGFSFDEFFSMVDTTFKSFSDIKYKAKIKDIKINGNEASVEIVDTTTGTLANSNENGVTFGDLAGDCDYVIQLKKQGRKWLVVSDYVISETTSLRYGDARGIKMDITAPQQVKPGDDYSIILNMEPPKEVFVVASLNREEIVTPPVHSQEIFRKPSVEGELERIVQANKIGKNEYAVASIGLTKIKLGEDLASIKFQMSGLSFLMSRVNVEKPKVEIEPQKEEKVSKTIGSTKEPETAKPTEVK